MVCIVIINIILQATIIKEISIGGISPDLLIITTVSFSLLFGRVKGSFLGLAVGLLRDIFYLNIIGFYALIYVYCGYLTGSLDNNFHKDSLVIPTIIIAICDLAKGLFVYIITYLLRGRTDIGYYFIRIIIPEVVYTTLLAVILYRFYYYLHNKMKIWSRKEASKI